MTVERLSDSHMLVSWDPLSLETARGHVQHYTVHYHPSTGASGQTMEVASTDSSVLISGLESSVSYFVTVMATTGEGDGSTSDNTDVPCEWIIMTLC